MKRIALNFAPLGALALGGLGFSGSAPVQALEDAGKELSSVVSPDNEGEDAADVELALPSQREPAEEVSFLWPDFLDVAPLPGLYRMTTTLVEFEFSPEESVGDFDLEKAMRETYPKTEQFCVPEDYQPAPNWVDELQGEDCTAPLMSGDSSDFSMTTQCAPQVGEIHDITITGNVREERSQIHLLTRSGDDGFDELTIGFRMQAVRVGDCDIGGE